MPKNRWLYVSVLFVILTVIGFLVGIKFFPLLSLNPKLKTTPAPTFFVTSLPANRPLILSLTRIDNYPGFTPDPTKIELEAIKISFNTIDETGKYFLYGIYETSGEKIVVSGIVTDALNRDGLRLSLKDEFGHELPVTVILKKNNDSFPVGNLNVKNGLDFRKEIKIQNRQITEIENKIKDQKVVAEIENDQITQDELNKLIQTNFSQKISLPAKVIYIKE